MSRPLLQLSPEDRAALERAVATLEHPSLAARISSVIGSPVEQAVKMLPRTWHQRIHRASEIAIGRALHAAIISLGPEPPAGTHDRAHRLLAITSGAVGGFFGAPGLMVELPFTTVLMLRAIADIAHGEGEPLDDPMTRLACFEVFALGGRSHADDYAEIGYYEVRLALTLHLQQTLGLLTETASGPPAAIALVRVIAQRFGVVVSDKVAAQLVPVLGAGAGALINAVFMQHFQQMARGHFTIRRLERRYGPRTVEAAYRELADVTAG